MSAQERLLEKLVHHMTKLVCNAILALAKVKSYAYQEGANNGDYITPPGGLPGHWREMGANLMAAIYGYIINPVRKLMP